MIDPEQLIEVGRALLEPSANEARLRTSVGRSYYGAMHKAQNAAYDLGFRSTSDRSVHITLIQFLESRDDPKLRDVGRHLDRLRRQRNRADYDLDLDVTTPFAHEALRRAERIFAELA